MIVDSSDFPILRKRINGKRLVYLDSAATSLKPKQMIEAITAYYRDYSANVHRGIYAISEKATEEFEEARTKVSEFIGAEDPSEIIFVRNATEAINLVAYTWGRTNIKRGDAIISSVMEHHSNLVPWQQLAKEGGAKILYLDITNDGQLDLSQFKDFWLKKLKLVAITHVSNTLGTINPIKEITKVAHEAGALVLVDGAQAVPHMPINVTALGCDFYAFSGHKMLGPTGIGVLWVRRKLLDGIQPFLFGGEMISRVSLRDSEFKGPPHKFEAGTPHIAGAIGLGAAIDYLRKLGMDKVREHEQQITRYAIEKLSKVDGIHIYGLKDASKRGGVLAFSVLGIHPHDLASILDEEGIAIRAGHHCTMPLHTRLGVPATARASFYVYNKKEDVDSLVNGIKKAQKLLGRRNYYESLQGLDS